MNLANKRVLITAAAQGIGRASVLAFRDAGARVFATDLHIEALQDIPGITTLQLDVTRPAAITAISQQMRNLEQDMGMQLLERSAQGVVPTAAGQTLYRNWRRSMGAYRKASTLYKNPMPPKEFHICCL